MPWSKCVNHWSQVSFEERVCHSSGVKALIYSHIAWLVGGKKRDTWKNQRIVKIIDFDCRLTSGSLPLAGVACLLHSKALPPWPPTGPCGFGIDFEQQTLILIEL